MGTSTRNTLPRLKKKIEELNSSSNINTHDLKKLLGSLLYPNNRESFTSNHIIKSLSSPNFIRTIKKVIRTSENYVSSGTLSFGILEFDSYSFNEQVDLIADYFVDYEDPILKQTIKDILLENGIDGTFANGFMMFKKIISIYVEHKIEGTIFEMLSEKYETISDEDIYSKINSVTEIITNSIISPNAYDKLVLNIGNENYVEGWMTEHIPLILKGISI